MNKFAVAVAIGLGLNTYTLGHAADSIKPAAPKLTTSSPAASSTSAAASTPATTKSTAQSNGVESRTVATVATVKSRHHKKAAHKHKKGELIGDGEPLSKIGEHKDVDGGFDFSNSKKFVK